MLCRFSGAVSTVAISLPNATAHMSGKMRTYFRREPACGRAEVLQKKRPEGRFSDFSLLSYACSASYSCPQIFHRYLRMVLQPSARFFCSRPRGIQSREESTRRFVQVHHLSRLVIRQRLVVLQRGHETSRLAG